MKTIFIDGVEHPIQSEQQGMNWTDIMVSRRGEQPNAACHTVPTPWYNKEDKYITAKTGGHSYSFGATAKDTES